jgi:hypothetical protein
MPKKKNKYIKDDLGWKICLYKPFTKEIIDYAIISECDFEKATTIFWQKTKYGYARGRNKDTGKDVLLHTFILDTNTNNVLLDHINRNKLDCRRENIRYADKQLNSLNRETPKNSTTGYRGVSFDKRRNKYRAHIKLNQKQISLGYFSDITAAIDARKQYELKHLPVIFNEL